MVFEHKMVPLVAVTVLDVLDVWKREYWSIQSDRKNPELFKLAAQAHAASAPGDMLKPHECCGLVRFGSCDILDLMGCATCSNVQ